MNPLQKCNAHTSLQFAQRRSNRFGENRLAGHCRAVFSKQAAPRSHAFFSCHEPLPPDSRCGELRGGLSSRSARRGEQRPVILKPRRSRPAGSIGLRGGSYCWRASSARGWQAGSRQRTICCNRHRPFSRYNCDSAPLRQQSSRVANPADNKLSSRQITNMPKPSSPRSGYLNRPQSLRRP